MECGGGEAQILLSQGDGMGGPIIFCFVNSCGIGSERITGEYRNGAGLVTPYLLSSVTQRPGRHFA